MIATGWAVELSKATIRMACRLTRPWHGFTHHGGAFADCLETGLPDATLVQEDISATLGGFASRSRWRCRTI